MQSQGLQAERIAGRPKAAATQDRSADACRFVQRACECVQMRGFSQQRLACGQPNGILGLLRWGRTMNYSPAALQVDAAAAPIFGMDGHACPTDARRYVTEVRARTAEIRLDGSTSSGASGPCIFTGGGRTNIAEGASAPNGLGALTVAAPYGPFVRDAARATHGKGLVVLNSRAIAPVQARLRIP